MNTLAAIFIATSTQFGLPSGLLESLCYVESTHNVNAVHHDDGGSNSVGICQLKLTTVQGMGFQGTEEDLKAPAINIYYAGRYLAHQRDRYHSVVKAVIAYNKGHAGVLTSSKYSDKVMKQWGTKKHVN